MFVVKKWFLAQSRCLWKLGIGIIIGIYSFFYKWLKGNVWPCADFNIKNLSAGFGLFR